MGEETLIGQLRHTLARMESALGAVDQGLVFTDQHGVVEWTNHAFEGMVGLSRLQCLGRYLPDILPTRYHNGKVVPRDCIQFWSQFFPGRAIWELSDSLPRTVVEVTWASVTSSNPPSLVFTFRDQSAITQAQDKLVEARDQMERQVQLRTQQLLEARDEALAASRAKTRFLASMSHDIRTPLNAILGMIDLLGDSQLDAAQKEMVSTIQMSGSHLLALINDVLDIAQIETGVTCLKETRFNLTQLLEGCLAQFQPQAHLKGISLKLRAPSNGSAWLVGDDLKLCQIMNNLIGNSLKYTNEGAVNVTAELNPEPSGTVIAAVEVADTGVGIEPDFLPKVFEEFSRFSTSMQSVESTGLGLAICARLCKALGGDISVVSKPGKGSCFTIKIPFISTVDPSMGSSARADDCKEDRSLHILIADDNRVNQRVLQLMLNRLGLQAELALDGCEAMGRIRQVPTIDLVFMDLEMPNLDGLAATRMLRAEGHQHPYIIALTAYSFDSQRLECEDAGMNDFLTKPLQKTALSEALQRFEDWRQQERHGGSSLHYSVSDNPEPSPQAEPSPQGDVAVAQAEAEQPL